MDELSAMNWSTARSVLVTCAPVLAHALPLLGASIPPVNNSPAAHRCALFNRTTAEPDYREGSPLLSARVKTPCYPRHTRLARNDAFLACPIRRSHCIIVNSRVSRIYCIYVRNFAFSLSCSCAMLNCQSVSPARYPRVLPTISYSSNIASKWAEASEGQID